MAIYDISGTLVGASPLLQSNKAHQHPSDPLNRLRSPLSKKGTKGEQDHMSLARIDFVSSVHWLDEDDGDVAILPNGHVEIQGFARPYIPGDMLRASLKESSRALKNKKGAGFDRGVQIVEDFELHYDGPKDCNGMWEAGFFQNDGACRNGGKLVWITRGRIPTGWSIDFNLRLDSSQLEVDDLRLMIEAAGKYIGVGSWRPSKGGRFGRYVLDRFETVEVKD